MKAFYFSVIFFLCVSYLAFPQQKYLRAVEKGRFEKLSEMVLNALESNQRDLDANIGATLLYYRNESPYYDIRKAHLANVLSKELFQEITDEKRIGKLNEQNINLDYFLGLQDSIYYKSYTQLIETPSVESCNDYMNFFTDLPRAYKSDVLRLRNKLAYQLALTENKVSVYQQFIDNYPDAVQIYDVIKRRDELAYQSAISSKDIAMVQAFIDKYPSSDLRLKAIEVRDRLAYDRALSENSVSAFQRFLTIYPKSKWVAEVTDLRDKKAFETTEDNLAGWEEYVNSYPSSKLLNQAKLKLYGYAWEKAKAMSTVEAYENFIQKYAQSSFAAQAKDAISKIRYDALMKAFSVSEAKRYLQANSVSTRYTFSVADSLIKYAFDSGDPAVLEEVVQQTSGEIRNRIYSAIYYYHTLDGEMISLEKYFESSAENDSAQNGNVQNKISPIGEFVLPKEMDFEIARLGDELYLNGSFDPNMLVKYEEYIRLARGKERSFIAIQKIIKEDLDQKNWARALAKVEKYTQLILSEGNYLDSLSPTIKKLSNLKEILFKPYDASIIPKNWGMPVNTLSGREYAPTLSADDKTLFFIGGGRPNNLPSDRNDEDIFVSKNRANSWSPPVLVRDLSSPNSNEGVQHISSDATKLLLFINGALHVANKSLLGWDTPLPLDQINTSDWQADANFTSDNNAMLFTSSRPTNYNFALNGLTLSEQRRLSYHGESGESVDIYVSLKDVNGNWGEAINLGPVINTDYNERSPFLHPDMKTLYFSSSGHGGLGSMDVFKSTRLSDTCWTCWSKPENLGKEINTTGSDSGYKISTSGEMAYFTYEKSSNVESSILFLLDISGSMEGEKLEALKQATMSVCKSAIEKKSEIAILTFGNNCRGPIVDIYPFTKDISNLGLFIDNLSTIGGTPMYEAYYVASEFMKNYSSRKSTNKVITLMTDGMADGCMSNLAKTLTKLKSKKILFKTQTIAFDVNENSVAYYDLKTISNFSKGNFYHANNTEELGLKFESANNDIFSLNSGSNNKDIYYLKLPPSMRPEFVAKIQGKLTDKSGNKVDAQIKWEDLELNKTIGVSNVDPETGEYFIILPMGKLYGYYVQKTGYYPVANNLDLRKYNKPVDLENNIQMVSLEEMVDKGLSVIAKNLFFETNKSDLLPYSIPELERVSKIIKTLGRKIQILGHTDDVGTVPFNQALSERRAESVMKYLISLGCDPAMINSMGLGKSMPVADNQTEAGRAANRRVEIKFSN